jgi:hypothetical protein
VGVESQGSLEGLSKVHEVILLLALYWFWENVSPISRVCRVGRDSPSAMPLIKCSCPSLVAPSRNAIIPASTHTAFNCAPLNSSVLRAISSKLTSGPVDILREWISRIRARAVSPGSGNSILRSSRPERRSAGSRISIRFVAAMTCKAYQHMAVGAKRIDAP